MIEKIFFQSSMPRSGSTMLQNIIAQNPDFYVTPTSGLLELVFGARENFTKCPEFKAQDRDIMEKAFISFCKGGVESYFNSITDKKYVLDKSRGWGVYRPFLDAFYPEPKIICMVRDLRDVFTSYEKIYRKNQALRHDPIRNDAEARGTTIHKRIDEWAMPKNTIGMALERLFEIIRQGYDNKILFVNYEDLCLYPETELLRIYDYLGVPSFKHDFDNIEQVTFEDDEVFGMGDLHSIRPKLEWKKSEAQSILGADICKWIKDNYTWYFQKFNYK